MPSNQAEKTFVKDFTSLMRRANFELLTNEEYMRSEGDGFILDINSKVRCPAPCLCVRETRLEVAPPLRATCKCWTRFMAPVGCAL